MDPIQPVGLTDKEINELEDIRIDELNEAGIDERDVLGNARNNLNIWQSYFNENITIGKDDIKFATRDQWSALERSIFTQNFKLCMQSNKIIDTVNKVCGEQRKNRPDLMVRSINGKASQEEINLREDLVRSISYESQNDLIYQNAFRSGLLMGWGAFQVDIDYESPRSFNKVIKYKMITDATKASWDPSAIKPHKGDGDYCSYQYIFSKEQFYAKYPNIINPISYADHKLFLDFQWETSDSIVLCDYFIKDWFNIKLLKLSDGRTVTEEEWDEIQKTEIKLKSEIAESSTLLKNTIKDLIPTIIGERRTKDYKIMRYHLIKDRILEFDEWPSKYLPIIFVDGNSDLIEGRQYTKSFVHDGRDMQRYINFLLSERATEIKNRRKEQWIGTPDNIVGQEQMWRNTEVQLGILLAKPDSKTGAMPIKSPAWQLSPELLSESQMASQDLREIMGFNESQELQGRDISGKARRERKIEGSMACYVQFDNLSQSIAQSGRVVLDLLPYVIGEDERHMIITRKDGKTENKILNKQNQDGSVENKIEGGEYDIEISTGPSFAVQKEMALEFFQQTIQANPQTFPLVADLWAQNLDIQFRDQVAERFKTMVPPQILAKEDGKQLPPQPPSPQEQAMQMEMKLKQAELQEKQDELKIKMQELELKKADLMLKAQKNQMDNQLNVYDHKLNLQKSMVTHSMDKNKSEMDYSAKIAKILSDMHKQKNDSKD
jgi:hypothetical protein